MYTGSWFLPITYPGFRISDPGSFFGATNFKKLKILGSGIRDLEKTYSGSGIQGSKRHWIPDPKHSCNISYSVHTYLPNRERYHTVGFNLCSVSVGVPLFFLMWLSRCQKNQFLSSSFFLVSYWRYISLQLKLLRSHKTVELRFFLNFFLADGRIGSIQIVTDPDPASGANHC